MSTRFSLRTKVLLAPLAVTVLLVAVATVSIGLLRSQGEAFRDVVGTAFDAATTTSRLTLTVASIHSDLLRRIEPGNSGSDLDESRALGQSTSARFALAQAMVQSLEANAQFLDANVLHDVSDLLSVYRTVAHRIARDGPRNPTLVSSLMAHYSQLDALLTQLAEATIRAAKDKQTRTQSFVDRSVWLLIFGVALTLVIATAATWGIGRAMSALHQRELELAHTVEKLAEMRDHADSASRAKSAFLASMSHELRTPLNAILGYAQILRRDRGLDARHCSGLQTIQRSGQFLLMLINDILDLAKIEAGKLELYPGPVELPSFLAMVCDIVRVRSDQKGLRFTLETDPELPCVVIADEKRLRQVLLNLLGNAVKFTERGAITLRVERVPQPDPLRARVRFEVADTGVGVGAADRERIFKPFEQAGEAHYRIGGTGLGLAISSQLVASMGGAIQVSDAPGGGSRFAFDVSLPVSGRGAFSGSDIALPQGYRGRRRKVLVVDDISENRAVVRDLLTTLGFAVVEATNGLDALEKAQCETPDLMVIDVVMPVMDGLTAIGQLRAMPAFSALPILAVSASISKTDADRTIAVGANLFIPKPIDFDILVEAIGRILALEWVRSAVRAPAPQPAGGHSVEGEARDQGHDLPEALRAALVRALVELDAAAVGRSIEEVGERDPKAAALLSRMAEEFQYDEMLRWLGAARLARQGDRA